MWRTEQGECLGERLDDALAWLVRHPRECARRGELVIGCGDDGYWLAAPPDVVIDGLTRYELAHELAARYWLDIDN